MNYLPQPTPVRDRERSDCALDQEPVTTWQDETGPAESWIDARQELFALKCELSDMAFVPAWRLLARTYNAARCCLAISAKVRVR